MKFIGDFAFSGFQMRHSLFVRVLCALLFAVFTFLYLYCYQADIMVVAQHIASGGKTRYVPVVGAVLITIVLYFLHLGVFALTKLGMRTHALTYLPSLLLLAFVTDLPSDVQDRIVLGAWVWIFPVFVILYAFVVFIARNYQEVEPEPRATGLASQLVWINLAVLLPMFVLVGIVGNHDEEFHKRARTERLIADGKYAEAYGMTLGMDTVSPVTAMLRAYALYCDGKLGEKLFETPVAGSSASLVPDNKDIRTLILPRNVIAEKARTNVDYVLCRCLIDRKLRAFVYILRKYYNPSRPLPKHYKEALILYSHKYGSHGVEFEDGKMEEEYAEFEDLRGRHGGDLTKKFGGTYWAYYGK